MMIKKAKLLLNTIRYFKARQLWFNIVRRLLSDRYALPLIPAEQIECLHNKQFDLGSESYIGSKKNCISDKKHFVFLNKEASFGLTDIDWRGAGQSKLWRYNLHYFDYLLLDALSVAEKADLLDSWIVDNPLGAEDAWEPYTCSLRIVNWIKYFQYCQSRQEVVKSEWRLSLYQQCHWLDAHMEYHIEANHLFKNLVAMTFACCYFNDEYTRPWLKHQNELLRQLYLQFLPDGGHYERTPSYHAVQLSDCLDTLNLAQCNPSKVTVKLKEQLRRVSAKAYVCLQQLTLVDGQLPLWNDSAFDSTPDLVFLQRFASTVLGDQLIEPVESQRTTFSNYLPDFGAMIVSCQQDQLCFNVAEVGPDHQPGHTHCDTLSYKLLVAGERVFVDTGTDDYSQASRQYCRSTAGHNCLQLDGAEIHEIWGQFRVARRAKVLEPELGRTPDGGYRLSAAHTGYQRLANAAIHKRQIDVRCDDGVGVKCVKITDQIIGDGRHRISSYLHIAPHHKVVIENGYIGIQVAGKAALKVHYDNYVEPCVEQTSYYSEFGKQELKTTVCFTAELHCPKEIVLDIEIEHHI